MTNEDIVLDPQGFINSGQKHRIPFDLTETDISSDCILLTPAPEVICFALETPDGDLITPAVTPALPGTDYVAGQNTSYYRMTLPVPTGAGAAAGRWHAVLEIEERAYKRYLSALYDKQSVLFEQTAAHGVRYSLNVHTYSNLRLRGGVTQDGYEAGATMTVQAVLTEYGLPVSGRATVRAELRRPDGTTTTISLKEKEPGVFRAATQAASNGVYRFRLRASGVTLRERPFTREQIVTGAVWRGGNSPPPTAKDDPDATNERLCRFVRCLLSRVLASPDAEKRLAKCGIRLDELRKCVDLLCEPAGRPGSPLSGRQLKLLQSPQFVSQLRQFVDETAE